MNHKFVEIQSFEQQMKSLGKQAEIVIYPEAGHAFEYPENTAKELGLLKAAYPADAAYQGPRPDDTADAWKRTVDFLDANLKSARSVSDAEQEVLALEEQMESLQRANSAERTALWAEDLVYINNEGAVFDKARLAPAVSAGEVKVESLQVMERNIRVYGDVAIVTAKENMRASFHGRALRDFLQRYTRVWARRSGKWQMVSFQATEATDMPPQTAGFETCSSEHATLGFAPTSGSTEEMILRLEEEKREANLKGETRPVDDYVAITSVGVFDKAATMRLFAAGGVKRLALKLADKRVRVFGDTAIVTGIWCSRSLREGKESAGAGRYTHVWVKRNAKWEVVSWQITPIPPQGPVQSSTPVGPDDTNHAQDEAAIRKIVADVKDAWNRRDPKGMGAAAHLTEDYDHINVGGKWSSGKDRSEKAMTDFFATHRPPTVAQSIEKIRFITPDVAICVVRNKYSNDERTWEGLSTLVLRKMNGEWWNEAFQNTLIQSREEAIAQAARASSLMAQTEPEVITPGDSKIDFSGDVAVIRKRAADAVDAWNRRDPKAETARVSENHDHINVVGAWRQGKAETDKAMTAALATTRNNISSSIAKIRFITPDVAIVIVRHQYTNDKEALKSISTSVLHKMNGEWWNEAFQNTYVQPR